MQEQLANGQPSMIRLCQIKKSFQDKSGVNDVLRGIDLDVLEREFVSIMGPSGAGKSLLLSILGMYDSSWQGEYYFLDHAIHRLNPKERAELNKRYIGFVFQQFHLLDDLTVAENLDVPLSYRNIRKSEREALVADMLDRIGMVARRNVFPSRLSGGLQQLVAVARAIIARPRLLLADEPTGNLHSEQGRQIMELFQKLNREGTTIIQVTHSEFNAAYGNRVLHILDGQIEEPAQSARGSDAD
jgi:ABC-type lipoprotein export system ATPase subunit